MFASTLAASVSTVIPRNRPMGIIFYSFTTRSWIGDHCSVGLPMPSHVYFGKTFTSNPKSRITWSISYSPIYALNLISLPVLVLCFPIFRTTRSSPGSIPSHLFMSSCSPFTALLLRSSFMHVSRKIVSIDGSISSSGLSLLPKVEASTNLFLASMKVSRVRSKSNSASFIRDFRTQLLSFGCLPLSSPIVIPLWSTMFTFRSSSCGSDLIIYRFWVKGCSSTPLSCILAISVGQSSISWSNSV